MLDWRNVFFNFPEESYLGYNEVDLVDQDVSAIDAHFDQATQHFESVVVSFAANNNHSEILAFIEKLGQNTQQQSRAENNQGI